MDARITITALGGDSAREVTDRLVDALDAIRWTFTNDGSELSLPRLVTAAEPGAMKYRAEDSGHEWEAELVAVEGNSRDPFGDSKADFLRRLRRILNNDELCAEAMLAEVGELVNGEEAER